MKSQSLQEMIKRIFSDENTKLTEHEKKAVLNTSARLGLATSGSTRLEATIEPLISWY
jgi:hypothetical protein